MDWSNDAAHTEYQRAERAFAQGHATTAMYHADRCLCACSATAEISMALLLKGTIAVQIGQAEEARQCFARAIEIAPDAEAHRGLCVAHIMLGEFGPAADQARAGLARLSPETSSPLRPSLLYNLAFALHSDDQLIEAVQAYRAALDLRPNHFAARENLAVVLELLDQLDEAIVHCRLAVELNPQSPSTRANLGHMLLAVGRYAEAWPHFEYRWANLQSGSGQAVISPSYSIPQWQGEATDARRHRLLVVHEQGLGDALQFCRYLPLLRDRFAGITLVCPQPLLKLLEQSMCSADSKLSLLGRQPHDKRDMSAWDWHIPMMSLPKAFGTTLETVPATLPYLRADPLAVRHFADRLNTIDRSGLPRIGVVWAGGHAGLGVDQWRSILAQDMAPLLNWRHARWISLQKPESDDKRLPPTLHAKIIDWMDEIDDFADTAALIASLDLVIAVDTSVAHLAAALGKPVWLLNRFAGCWRWMRGRDESPWYPGTKIFTQTERGNWSEVLERVLRELETLRPSRHHAIDAPTRPSHVRRA